MVRSKAEDELRRKLARQLKRSDVPDHVWKYLVAEGYATDALTSGTPDDFDYLLEQAKAVLRHFSTRPARSHRKPGKTISVAPLVPPAEAGRGRAYSVFLCTLAAEHAETRLFRSQILGGRTLSREEASLLLDCDLPRFFGLGFFLEHGIPLVGHHSRIICYRKDGREIPMYSAVKSVIRAEWAGHVEEIPYTFEMFREKHQEEKSVLAVLQDAWRRTATRGNFRDRSGVVLKRSVFGRLLVLTRILANEYFWQESDASWFILTGEEPPSSPISVQQESRVGTSYNRVRLTISMDAWVSPRTVARVYKNVQKQVFDGRSKSFSERNLALFEFLSRYPQATFDRSSWRDLMGEWNDSCEKEAWKYHDPRLFHRDVKRTTMSLCLPKFNW
jgi:hypothetical protein